MFNVNLKALVDRMNPTLKEALDNAAGLCLSKGHYNIEIEHWLQKILEKSDTDAEKVISHFGLNVGKVLSELNSALNKLKSGNTRTPSLSQTLQDSTKYAWMIASIDMSHNSISSGHLLAAMLNDEALRRQFVQPLKAPLAQRQNHVMNHDLKLYKVKQQHPVLLVDLLYLNIRLT
jgi:type VI secretion system protein VasG